MSGNILPKVLRDYCARFDEARTTGLILSGSVGPLTLGVSAQTPAESDLINRTGRPILIDAIKIQCGLYDGTGGTVLTDAQAGSYWNLGLSSLPDDFWVLTESPLRALQMRLRLGGLALTRDYVPLYGLSPIWDPRSQALCVVWRPPCPIYIEEGEFLRPELRYPNYNAPAILGAGNPTPNTAVTPRVTYACRVLEDPQDWLQDGEARVLPFATSYTPAPLAMFAATSVQSEDTSLINSLDSDLYVHALVGKCVTQIFDTTVGNLDEGLQAAGGAPGPLANISENGIKVRMETSRGFSMVKDPTPFGHLFNVVDATWWMNTKLAPREFFRVYLDVDFTNPNLYVNDGSTVSPMIVLLGSFLSDNFGAATKWHRRARDAEFMGQGVRLNAGIS